MAILCSRTKAPTPIHCCFILLDNNHSDAVCDCLLLLLLTLSEPCKIPDMTSPGKPMLLTGYQPGYQSPDTKEINFFIK